MIVTLGVEPLRPSVRTGAPPLDKGRLFTGAPLDKGRLFTGAPLVKGSWREAPERLNPPGRNLSVPLRVTPPLDKGRLGIRGTKGSPC